MEKKYLRDISGGCGETIQVILSVTCLKIDLRNDQKSLGDISLDYEFLKALNPSLLRATKSAHISPTKQFYIS